VFPHVLRPAFPARDVKFETKAEPAALARLGRWPDHRDTDFLRSGNGAVHPCQFDVTSSRFRSIIRPGHSRLDWRVLVPLQRNRGEF
jgi:hypothetical protein